MADAETIRQQMSQTRAPFSAWLGVVLLFALFGGIVLAVIGPSPRHDNYEQARAKKRQDNLKTLRDEDVKSLSAYAWIDKNKGSARIPIERAMELTVADLKQKKPVPAGPIVTPSPAASGPAVPTPAPSAAPKASVIPKATAVSGVDSENRGQPAAASNPPNAPPATQPGAAATPAASPAAPAAKPAVSPAPKPAIPPPGSPLPVRGKETPSPTPS